MKKLLFIPLLFLLTNVFAQKSFIGSTKEQVKDYWSTKVSSDYYDEGTYSDDPTTDWFLVCQKCSGGSYSTSNPEFSADFIKNICVSNSYGIESRDLSVYIARFNKQFKYSDEKGGWIDAAKKQIWKIEGSSGNHSITVSKL